MADDVAQWLEGLGLGQYVREFAANHIDFEILSDLTEANLEKLGLSVGDQKRCYEPLLRDPNLLRKSWSSHLLIPLPHRHAMQSAANFQ